MDDPAASRSPEHARRRFFVGAIPWLVWGVAAILSGMGLRHYRIDNDFGNWIPELGAVGAVRSYAVVGFERGSFDEREIAAALRALPSVRFCLDSTEVERTERFGGVTPDHFVVSDDGTYAGVFVFRRSESDDDSLVRQIQLALTEYDQDLTRFALAGPAVFHVQLNDFSQRRLPLIMLLINLVGGLWLWWITGKSRVAAVAVAAIIFSQIVLLGIVSWQRIPVDMSLSMVPPLIMALGYSYAAHRALRRRITGTLILCCGTTAAGIASFGISDLPPLRMFALYGAAGMALVWLAVVTLLPPLADDERPNRRRRRWLDTLLRCNLAAVARYRKAIILTALVIASASIVSVRHLRFDTNSLGYFPPDSRIVRDFATIETRLTGTLPFQVTVTGSADPTDMLRSTSGVRKLVNVSVVVPGDAATYWGLADSDALPDLIAAQDTWQDWAAEHQAQLQWRGVAAQIHATGRILRRVAVITLPAMGLIAALTVGFVTRRFRMAAVAVLINLLPVCGLILIAAAARLSLGLPSLMIGAIAIGMSIDDTIHLVRAFERRGSTTRGLIRCWRPCVGSTFVTASCLALFAISPFRPTQQFGALLAAIALVALVADMLLLPVLSPRKRASG